MRHKKNDNRHLLECQTLKNEIADELLIATLQETITTCILYESLKNNSPKSKN